MKIPINLRSIGLVLNVTAALTDNIYSWFLSAMALVLMMLIGGQPPRRPTTSRRTLRAGGEERAREDGGTPRPPQHGDDAMKKNDQPVCKEMTDKLANMMQEAMTVLGTKIVHTPGNMGAPEVLFAAAQVALQAFIPAVGGVANTEHVSRETDVTDEFASAQISKAVSQEVLTFCGLYMAKILQSYRCVFGDSRIVDQTVATEAGPHILHAALEAWRKVYPDKDPKQYLEPNMVEAVDQAMAEAGTPLAEFMKKHGIAPGSTTLN